MNLKQFYELDESSATASRDERPGSRYAFVIPWYVLSSLSVRPLQLPVHSSMNNRNQDEMVGLDPVINAKLNKIECKPNIIRPCSIPYATYVTQHICNKR